MKIKVYGATWCAFCKTEKQWLDSKNVSYEYVDVDTNEEAKNELTEKTNSMSVPATIITKGDDEEIILGFNRPALADAIGV